MARAVDNVFRSRYAMLCNLQRSSEAAALQRVSLMAGGMSALTAAIAAAADLLREVGVQPRVSRLEARADYMELAYVVQDFEHASTTPTAQQCAGEESATVHGNILLLNLNPSSPMADPSGARGYREVDVSIAARAVESVLASRASCPLVVLVVDCTIETSERRLDSLLCALSDALRSGRLLIVLSKSYQKYATFGLAKVCVGVNYCIYDEVSIAASDEEGNELKAKEEEEVSDASAVARCAAHVRNYARELAWHTLEECQFLTHLLKHTPDTELELVRVFVSCASYSTLHCPPTLSFSLLFPLCPLLMASVPQVSRAAAGAEYVHEHCWPSSAPLDAFAPTLPFLVKGKPTARYAFEDCELVGGVSVM